MIHGSDALFRAELEKLVFIDTKQNAKNYKRVVYITQQATTREVVVCGRSGW